MSSSSTFSQPIPLQVPRRGQGRAGARGLGDHDDGQAGATAPSSWGVGVHRCVAGFLSDMKSRGLRAPPLVISDRALGIIPACELELGQLLRQRCATHRARNILGKVPKHAQGEVKAE